MGALDEVTDLAGSVVRRRSLRLWDVQLGGQPGRMVLRVLVDGDEGVDLDTVAQVSEEISRGLDLRDPIEGRYTLEVSSPGVERTLKTPEHFRLSVGRLVTIKTTEKLMEGSHRIDGRLVSASEDRATVETEVGEKVEVPLASVRSARTVFEWT